MSKCIQDPLSSVSS